MCCNLQEPKQKTKKKPTKQNKNKQTKLANHECNNFD